MMSRSGHLKDKNGKSNIFSVDSHDVESAARTRPISFEEIMLRRRNKELLENVKEPTMEAWNKSPGGSREKIADRFESERIYKHDKSSSNRREKHGFEEPVKLSSRKKLESTYVKEDDLTRGKDRANYIVETKSSAGLNNIGRVTKEKTGKEMSSLRKNERISDNSEYEARIKLPRDSANKDRLEVHRPKSERNAQRKKHIGHDEKFNDYHTERKHGKDRHDRGKRKKRLNNDSEEIAEKKHYRDSHDKDRHAQGKAQYDREIKRKYRNGDDEIQDRNATRKRDLVKHHNQQIQERKEMQANVKSHHGESTTKTTKRRRSRSREREDRRRRSLSFSPSAPKHTYHDGERKELPMLSLKDSSRKKHSDIDRSRVSTNGSSSHHHRHGVSTSGLGGYSPRKRKSEAAVKTPSPPKHSPEKKKRAGWDLPPVGADNPSPAFVSSSFQLSNHTTLPNMQNVGASASVDPAIMKLLPISFFNDVSTGKNANTDSVQLTQATRPMRRLYLENVPASVSEKDVMDYFNNLLHSAGVNHIQQRCISCILHKDRGQAFVEFLTAEDASAALSFDGNTLCGSIVKIRRPKDYVEVSTGEPERSMDAVVTISDVVIDSADKIFIGGISNHVSSEMIMEIAGTFGSLKAYHFETVENNGSCAFLEYVDHSVTIKACAGLNGLKLGDKVLTVVQAMPDALPQNNGGKPPSYGIPEHAKPLLRKPTQVLKIKNVFAVESISSLSDMDIEEVLEDVRLECARFGTIKSLNVVRDTCEKNLAAKSEFEVMNQVESTETSQDIGCNSDDAKPTFSEKSTSPKFEGTSDKEFCNKNELEEDKVDDGSSVDINAEVFDNKPCIEERITTDTAVEDTDIKSIPSSIILEGPDNQDEPKDGPELHDKEVANNTSSGIDEENMVTHTVDSKANVSLLHEDSLERDASAEPVDPKNCTDELDGIHDDVFEQGSVLVEYTRTEACRLAAYCLHGRIFDGRMVTVEYVSPSQYRERFEK